VLEQEKKRTLTDVVYCRAMFMYIINTLNNSWLHCWTSSFLSHDGSDGGGMWREIL